MAELNEVRDEAGGAPAARRNPAQQRSKDRMERILGAASALIAETGSDQVKMSEVAERAEISIGSLYQYFPDKAAIIRTLAERVHARSNECIAEALAGVGDLPGLEAAYAGLIDIYYSLFLREPVTRDIWSGMQADKQLAALELEACRKQGEMLAAVMRRVHPDVDAKRIDAVALLIWQLGESAMRLAIAHAPEEGARLIDAFKDMTLRMIAKP